MIKNLGYDGSYRNENISVSIMLDNPLDYGIEPESLLFVISLRSNTPGDQINTTDYIFYLMDEKDNLYNTQVVAYPDQIKLNFPTSDKPIHQADFSVKTDFKPEFLFQDLRIVFYCRTNKTFAIINMSR